MTTAIQPRTELAARPTLPAQGLNICAAVLSLALTTAVLGAVVLGMNATADQHTLTSVTSTSVPAG